ncbi:MAG: DegT/DnrJ/EryC1/StrS family aminotransferase [Pyrinomonadaceae bacterium]|nr:DegT/DnrJ/EryC1/StrS family aminotransferase [Pyrinomonadaceae bacterium]
MKAQSTIDTEADVRKIPITKTVFGPEEMAAVQKPLESGWVVQGPFVKQFEEQFSAFTGAPYSIATSSCTTALHIAVAALKLKPGDEVIVPAFTWVATANAVEYMGAKPVFCDIELDTFNIDPNKIEELITPRTVGLMPVHLFGLCADMAPVMELARENNLWVVEDAACAFGAWYQGQHAGTIGDAGCFSFHPRKSITTGEGGMITTARAELDTLSRSLRDHGASRSDLARHNGPAAFLLADYNHLGYNFRLTDIQGALGCAQMNRAEWILQKRTERARDYDRMLGDVEWLATPVVPEGYTHGYQAYVCLFRPEEPGLNNVEELNRRRNELMTRLEDKGISTRQGTHAAALVGYYSEKYGLRPEQFPSAYIAEQLSLTLPLYAQMTEDEQSQVCHMLKEEFV